MADEKKDKKWYEGPVDMQKRGEEFKKGMNQNVPKFLRDLLGIDGDKKDNEAAAEELRRRKEKRDRGY